MNLYIVVVLVVFDLSFGASNYHEYSSFVTDEDFEHQFFSDDLEDTNYTSESEELSKLKRDPNAASYTTVDTSLKLDPYSTDKQVEKDDRTEENRQDGEENVEPDLDHTGGHLVSDMNQKEEMTSEKHLLDHFSQIQHKVYSNYEESFQNKERKPNQTLMRREINAWQDEIGNSDNVPWSLDAFYPRQGSHNSQSDYFDDSSYPMESLEHRSNSTTEMSLNPKDAMIREEQLPYYQKNYFYNYYPLSNVRKYNKLSKWSAADDHDSDEIVQNRENSSGRKYMRKNSCRQYLQFLKYAFERLDGNPDYNYDYNDDYVEEWRERGGQRNKVLSVHLLGPTLYVDNSGKVSQINTKGNSYQRVDGVPPVPKTMMTLRREENKPRPTTSIPYMRSAYSKTERLTTLPNEVYDAPKTTTEIPWLKISLRTNFTAPNITNEPRFNTDIQHRSMFGTKVEEEWRQRMGDEVYQTTLRAATEHTVFDEYDYGDTRSPYSTENTHSPPKWFPSDEYYRNLAKALAKSENDTKSAIISSETNAAVGPPVYWLAPTSTPQETTFSPAFPKSYRYSESTETPSDFGDRRDVDCNDKMLPCPDTVNLTYPLNGYCNRYVSCESGRAIRKTCPDGLHFNIITKSCDLPHNSFCTYTCPTANGFYGIPGDCGGYFSCKNFIPDYRMCPPRMHWDIQRSTCTFAELSSCPMKCSKLNDVKHHEGDCKAYIICMNGIPYYHKCPPNMKFDKIALTCVPSQQSKCEDDPRLLTKTSNPNHLCREVEVKLGTKLWCNYFFSEDSQNPKKQF